MNARILVGLVMILALLVGQAAAQDTWRIGTILP